MSLPTRPLRGIFPIVVLKRDLPFVPRFLGTGFFINDEGRFLTAKHCLEGVVPEADEELVAVIVDGLTRHPISDIRFSEQFDIAAGRATGVTDIEVFEFPTELPHLDVDLLCIEFSGTTVELLEDGVTQQMNLIYYNHKGHIIRSYTSRYPEKVPTASVDLSFPALRGASGAPVWTEQGVIGMIVANVERHLLPAQVERIEREDGSTEERRYFLPFGKAIGWPHLKEFAGSL